MTRALAAQEVAARIQQSIPEAQTRTVDKAVLVDKGSLLQVANLLKTTPGLDFDYLISVTGVDYLDYFEMVYHLVSVSHNHSMVLKTRCYGREDIEVPSLTGLYQGADLQEREVYDLLGIRFTEHPNLKRILLWEGFPGHPLRKDFLVAPQQQAFMNNGTED